MWSRRCAGRWARSRPGRCAAGRWTTSSSAVPRTARRATSPRCRLPRQPGAHGTGCVQRERRDRDHPPHRARSGIGLSHQRARGARARRSAALRRRRHGSALDGPRRPGAHQRSHQCQADRSPLAPRGGGRHHRPALAPPRGGAAPARRRLESRAARRRAANHGGAAPGLEASGAPGQPLPQSLRPYPAGRGDAPASALAGGTRCARDRGLVLPRGRADGRRAHRPRGRRGECRGQGRGGAPAAAPGRSRGGGRAPSLRGRTRRARGRGAPHGRGHSRGRHAARADRRRYRRARRA